MLPIVVNKFTVTQRFDRKQNENKCKGNKKGNLFLYLFLGLGVELCCSISFLFFSWHRTWFRRYDLRPFTTTPKFAFPVAEVLVSSIVVYFPKTCRIAGGESLHSGQAIVCTYYASVMYATTLKTKKSRGHFHEGFRESERELCTFAPHRITPTILLRTTLSSFWYYGTMIPLNAPGSWQETVSNSDEKLPLKIFWLWHILVVLLLVFLSDFTKIQLQNPHLKW